MQIKLPESVSKIRTQKIRMTPRKQSGVIPFKVNKTFKPKFLLIRKTGSGAWGFPKGKVESHLGKKNSAQLEAWEEAGAKGILMGNVGRYSYIKGKTNRVQQVDLYLMEVKKVSSKYLETERERKWFTYEQALRAVQKTQQPFLRIALQMITDELGI